MGHGGEICGVIREWKPNKIPEREGGVNAVFPRRGGGCELTATLAAGLSLFRPNGLNSLLHNMMPSSC